MNENDRVLVQGVRTPFGKMQGSLASLSAVQLGIEALQGALEQTGRALDFWQGLVQRRPSLLWAGTVLAAGQGQAPARQVGQGLGLGEGLPAVTVNKVCGSGLEAILAALRGLQTGECEVAFAGGMESMSQAPFLLSQARGGLRFGNHALVDSVLWDGLTDAGSGETMGRCAEETARGFEISRAAQEDYAFSSFQRAIEAEKKEIRVKERKAMKVLKEDEGLARFQPETFRRLKPAFLPEGTITAATSSGLSDGAAFGVFTTARVAQAEGLSMQARMLSFAVHAQAPRHFASAPIGAIQKALQKAGWSISEVDLFEVNEAFAVVPLAVQKALQIPSEKLNVDGGALVLGHPLGATGARLVFSLVASLKARGLKRGVVSLCIGGGEALALCLECL